MNSKQLINFFAVPFLVILLMAGCSTNPTQSDESHRGASLLGPKPTTTPLQPVARLYTGNGPAVIQHLLKESAAQKAGLKVGDKILRLNGKDVKTAGDFEQNIKFAKRQSELTIRRGAQTLTLPVRLADQKPRFGAGFEPSDVTLVKKETPLVAIIHRKDMTIHANSSLDKVKEEMRLSLVIESDEVIPSSQLKAQVFEKGKSKPFATFSENLDVLGGAPVVFSRTFDRKADAPQPTLVRLEVAKKQFLFEFQ